MFGSKRIMVTRTFLGTSFLLRDHIPRHSVTPGLNGTNCMGYDPAGRVCAGTGLHFVVTRKRDIIVCAKRVCAGTEFHIYHRTAGFHADSD